MADEILVANSPTVGVTADAWASANASASLRRGIQLGTGANAGVQFAAGAGNKNASFKALAAAGVDASAVLRAALPIDLWDNFGVLAEARIGVRASASLSATGNLSLAVLADTVRSLVTQAVPDAPASLTGQALEAFLLNTRVYAGGFAEVSASAEAHAQAILAGTLFPRDGGPPRFSAVTSYGYGIGIGAGWSATTGIEIGNAEAFLKGITNPLIDDVVARFQNIDPSAAEALKVLLRAAIPAGLAIGSISTSVSKPTTVKATLGRIIRKQLVDTISQDLLKLAIQRLHNIISSLIGTIAQTDTQRLEAAQTAIDDARTALISARGSGTPKDLITASAAVVDAVRYLIDMLDHETVPEIEAARIALSILAAAVSVVGLAVEGASPAKVLGSGSLSLLGPGRPSPEIAVKLVISTLSDHLSAELSWISSLIGDLDLTDLLNDLINSQAMLADDAVAAIIVERIPALIDTVIEPALNTLAGNDANWLISTVVRPLLAVSTQVIAGFGADVAPDKMPDRLLIAREQISILLLSIAGQLAVFVIDACLTEALADAKAAAEKLAEMLENASPQAQWVVNAVAMLAAGPVGILLSDPKIIAELVRFAAKFVDLANEGREAFTLVAITALRKGPTVLAGLAEIEGPHDPSIAELVLNLAKKVGTLSTSLFGDFLVLHGKILVLVVKRVVEAVVAVVTAAIEVMKEAIDEVAKLGENIPAKIIAALTEAAAFLNKVKEFANWLVQQFDRLKDRLIEHLADTACDLVGLDEGEFGYDVAHALVKTALKLLLLPLDLIIHPLFGILKNTLHWMHNTLLAAAENLAPVGAVRSSLRPAISRLAPGSLTIPLLRFPPEIAFGIPPAIFDQHIAIDIGHIIEAIATTILGDDVIPHGLKQAEQDAAEAARLSMKADAFEAYDDRQMSKLSVMQASLDNRRCPDSNAVKLTVRIGHRDTIKDAHGNDFVEVGDGAELVIQFEGAPPEFDGTQIGICVGNVGEITIPDLTGWMKTAGIWYWKGVMKVVQPPPKPKLLPFESRFSARDMLRRLLIPEVPLRDLDITLPDFKKFKEDLLTPPKWEAPRPVPTPGPETLQDRITRLNPRDNIVRLDVGGNVTVGPIGHVFIPPKAMDITVLPASGFPHVTGTSDLSPAEGLPHTHDNPDLSVALPDVHVSDNNSLFPTETSVVEAVSDPVQVFTLEITDTRFVTMLPDHAKEIAILARSLANAKPTVMNEQYPTVIAYPGCTTITAAFADGFGAETKAYVNVIAIHAEADSLENREVIQ